MNENELLKKWYFYKHFESNLNKNIQQISDKYLGIYCNHPTSWMVNLSRNPQKNKEIALLEENSKKLMRIPAMRKSKFLVTNELGKDLFLYSKKGIHNDLWRLRQQNLTVVEYYDFISKIEKLTLHNPMKASEIAKYMNKENADVRVILQIATYDGALVRYQSDNEWSNIWKYGPPTNVKLKGEWPLEDDTVIRIVNKYVEMYGPVSSIDVSWWLSIPKGKAKELLNQSNAHEIDSDFWINDSEVLINRIKDFHIPPCVINFTPKWDPLLMGYAPNSKARKILNLSDIAYDKYGNGNPMVFLRGSGVGTWNVNKKGNERTLHLNLNKVSKKDKELIQCKARNWAKQIDVEFQI